MTAGLGREEKNNSSSGEESAEAALKNLSRILMPLKEGDFSAKMDKVLVYAQSAARSKDSKARSNFIRFARLNLDAALVQALDSLVFRPRLASKSDLEKRALALQKSFDRLEHPEKALLEHYRSSSDPLNKYLVAGPWGHNYLRNRGIDPEAFGALDRELCDLLGCGDTPAGKIVLAYAALVSALGRLESKALL